ncbi:FAD-dependent monooxygenase [Actinosynnema sp. NPDC047251]|uniref:Bifunctional monooxygenase-dehydratase like protein n=1 Tax=Saccharothrix espanaensis (strain ATCC 51144 / DSM 44229 / JCM 9112 / NBRC 15066 / NRRL 15764) TaxID=1179773 RepID=K0JXU1_SACES|nr:FAD-dependent monooxygenase [Saccharothrix espanaensis]CCH32750.1 Bifunctional monooxygenase-dehydratase like protein [Saccharothrix espanaensis DSM 44229]
MSAPGPDAPVAVVGAGPVGLMLAGELRLGGAEVVVLERRETPTTESRASTLHARTMEILDSRGLLERLGEPPNQPRGHFGGIPLDLTTPGRHCGQWKVPQTTTERLLAEWATGLGAEVRRGWTVRDVVDDGDGVLVVGESGRRLRAGYVVACDGQHSTVRKVVRAAFPGLPGTRRLVRADVAGVDVPDRRFQRLDAGLAIAARAGNGVTRVMAHEFGSAPAAAPDFAQVVALWRRITGEDISGGEPLWINSFDDANRQLERYRHGRVLFAGDAAHVQLPAGGQALNLGLHDAVNLGWKLAAVVRGHAPDGLLDTYHDERHAVGRRVLANIRAQALLLLGDRSVEPVRALLAELIATEPVRALLAGMISGVDVHYPPGGTGGSPPAGGYLPELALTTATGTTTTTALLRTGRGLLLDLTDGGRLRDAAAPWADRVTAVAGRPDPAPGAAGLLVRPDGHVAWAGADPDGARAALGRWFGTGRPPHQPREGD